MSQQHSDKAPILFHGDAAAYFSDEEWKLLHEWQKELYKNVMNEVHQALISLGPLIATTVFSLRAKEKEDLFPVDHQHSERRHNMNHPTRFNSPDPDNIARMERELEGSLTEEHALKGGENSTSPSSGHESIIPITSFTVKAEETYPVIYLDPAKRKNSNCPTGFHSLTAESEAKLMEGGESSPSLDSGPLIATTVFSLRAKEKEDLFPVDHQHSERRHNMNHPTRFNSPDPDNIARMEQELEGSLTEEHALKGGESSTNPSSAGKEVVTPVVSFTIEDEREACSMNNQNSERKGSIDDPTGVNKSLSSTNQQPTSNWDGRLTFSDFGRHLNQKLDFINHHRIQLRGEEYACAESGNRVNQQSALVNHKGSREQRPYTCTEYGKSFSESATLNQHQKIHTGATLCICNHCGNYFNQSTNVVAHKRINNGEKLNTCSECEKSIQQSTNLDKDQGKSTMERPYVCSECGMNFRQSQSLMIHQRIHTGERPYICSQCGKSFRRSNTLVTHQRLHTGEKPYTCMQCGKNFRQLPHIIKHRRMHSGEKPYICNVCERPFIDSSSLKRHQRLHTRQKP